MSAIKVRCQNHHGLGRHFLHVTCEEHPEFHWLFDAPSWDVDGWATALLFAYGHAAWAHPASTTSATEVHHHLVNGCTNPRCDPDRPVDFVDHLYRVEARATRQDGRYDRPTEDYHATPPLSHDFEVPC